LQHYNSYKNNLDERNPFIEFHTRIVLIGEKFWTNSSHRYGKIRK
jgi:hypothetical protein